MIAPQELRLGNWVQKAHNNQNLAMEQVTQLTYHTDDLQPIPISPEVLEASGFSFHTYFKVWQRNKAISGTGPEMELDRDFWLLDFSHHRVGVEIKTLHQLQNLFYQLKGRELEVYQLQSQTA
ncbi:hypothetical protein [Pseudocnuella soli]|uniref:hypothetical protein n=1 Tax=Pseudocnuella soli TaxID=2502779 RepID=UPI00104C2291|nr:hypothetical protein [Pseudocnuella soli]